MQEGIKEFKDKPIKITQTATKREKQFLKSIVVQSWGIMSNSLAPLSLEWQMKELENDMEKMLEVRMSEIFKTSRKQKRTDLRSSTNPKQESIMKITPRHIVVI